MYNLAEASVSAIGYTLSLLIPLSALVILVAWQVKNFSFSLPVLAILLLLFPAFTPVVADALGYNFFTRLNFNLQLDAVLKVAAVYLISIFCAFFVFGSLLAKETPAKSRIKITFPLWFVIGVMILNFFLIIAFLEVDTVVFQDYGSIKVGTEAPYSSLVNQFFNASVAFCLCYSMGSRRRTYIFIYCLIMIAVFLIFARRTTALGLIIILIYSYELRELNARNIGILAFSALALYFIGEARSVGILDYMQGERIVQIDDFFALPGGASNLFVGTMGVIHMIDNDILAFPETHPMLIWATGLIEADIYGDYYQYNGGMHLASTVYWNFRLIGMPFVAIFLGWLTMKAHFIMSKIKKETGGTLIGMLSFAYILILPNFLWYHPMAIIKLSIAIPLFYFTARLLLKDSLK